MGLTFLCLSWCCPPLILCLFGSIPCDFRRSLFPVHAFYSPPLLLLRLLNVSPVLLLHPLSPRGDDQQESNSPLNHSLVRGAAWLLELNFPPPFFFPLEDHEMSGLAPFPPRDYLFTFDHFRPQVAYAHLLFTGCVRNLRNI